MKYKYKDYDIFKDYYLVKPDKKYVKTYLPFSDETAAIAKVINENENFKVYGVSVPYREGKDLTVKWYNYATIEPADNYDKKFLPLNDVLYGAFETSENRRNINFKFYHNQYNIGFGYPLDKNQLKKSGFFELGVNERSVDTKIGNNINPQIIKAYLKQLDFRLLFFLTEVEKLFDEIIPANDNRVFETFAIVHYRNNRKRIKTVKLLPAFVLADLYEVYLKDIMAYENRLFLKEYLPEKLNRKIEKDNIINYFGLTNDKNLKKIKFTKKDKKQFLLAYFAYAKDQYQKVFWGDVDLEEYNKETKHLASKAMLVNHTYNKCLTQEDNFIAKYNIDVDGLTYDEIKKSIKKSILNNENIEENNTQDMQL